MKKLGLALLLALGLGMSACFHPAPTTEQDCLESWHPVKESSSPVSRCLILICGTGNYQTTTTLFCEEKK
jgi:hypothetical protein